MSRPFRALIMAMACGVALGILPFAYTGPDQSDKTPAPTPTPSPSPSPEPEPSPSATPQPDPGASPSPSPEPRPSAPTETPPPEELQGGEEQGARELLVEAQASPARIEVGEETTVSARVTNEGDEVEEDLEVGLVLPGALEFVSADPPGARVHEDPDSTFVGFTLGDLSPDESVVVSVTARGLEEDESVTVSVEARSAAVTAFDTATVAIEAPAGALVVTSRPTDLLSEVGGNAGFVVTVTNAGDSVLRNVSVVELVDRELHVVSANLPPGVDAVQVGRSGRREDIVWIINELTKDKTIALKWGAVVAEAGDLAATSTVTATADNSPPATSETTSYVAVDTGGGTDNPEVEGRTKRIVTREKVVERPLIKKRVPLDSIPPGATVLPFTGIDPWGIAVSALVLIFTGVALLRIASARVRPKRLAASSLLLLLVATACVSNDGGPDGAAPEVSPRVKGRQIERGDGGGERDEPAPTPGEDDRDAPGGPTGPDEGPGPLPPEDDDESEPEPDEVVVLVPGEPEVRFVRRVRVETVDERDLPIRQVGSIRSGPARFTWNDAAAAMGGAASARARTGVAEVTTTLADDGTGIRATVTLRNISTGTRLAVDGRLSLQITGGVSEILTGSASRRVLNPGGELSESFTFRLPSGTYGARAVFQPS
ncbi:MAG: hypothetical protein M3280_01025 [Actinomycetota bacterium]|nr:hypothetical protein [Actinomycetota bacterium]